MPTPSETSAPPPSICEDLPCHQCSYNLLTLLPTANCPECNHPISSSMQNASLRSFDPHFLPRNQFATTFYIIILFLSFPLLLYRLADSLLFNLPDILLSMVPSSIWQLHLPVQWLHALLTLYAISLFTLTPNSILPRLRHSRLQFSLQFLNIASFITFLFLQHVRTNKSRSNEAVWELNFLAQNLRHTFLLLALALLASLLSRPRLKQAFLALALFTSTVCAAYLLWSRYYITHLHSDLVPLFFLLLRTLACLEILSTLLLILLLYNLRRALLRIPRIQLHPSLPSLLHLLLPAPLANILPRLSRPRSMQ